MTPTLIRPRDAILLGALIFLASLAACLWDVGSPGHIYFDETWYVPAARAWLATGENLHPEHPPLAKVLIGCGMALFGDDPFGWRFMSAVFGALTMLAMYLWALALFEDFAVALWTTAVTGFDQILFVQSRIAMLDVFMFAFVTLGLAAFTYAMKTPRAGRAGAALALMGASFGLAGACKFSGFFTLLGLFPLAVLVWGASRRKLAEPGSPDFSVPVAVGALAGVAGFVLAPALAYGAAYLPQAIRHGSLLYVFQAQYEMFHIMLGSSATHPYASLWYTWPALWRPVWYLFDVAGGDTSRWSDDVPAAAILAIANPLIQFAGQVALLAALWRFFRRLEFEAGVIAVAFLAQWLPWVANPKGLEFDYYYFPSILALGPALALAFFRPRRLALDIAGSLFLVGAAVMFLFFLPTLAADFGVTPDELDLRTWASSWR